MTDIQDGAFDGLDDLFEMWVLEPRNSLTVRMQNIYVDNK